jgi:hypothetical protein
MVVEPDMFFEDFADEVILTKSSDGSTTSTVGIYDEAAAKFDTDGAPMSSFERQVTVSRSVALHAEGDRVTVKGNTYEILDHIKDDAVVIYHLTTYIVES